MACISTTHSAPGSITAGRCSTRVMISFHSGSRSTSASSSNTVSGWAATNAVVAVVVVMMCSWCVGLVEGWGCSRGEFVDAEEAGVDVDLGAAVEACRGGELMHRGGSQDGAEGGGVGRR